MSRPVGGKQQPVPFNSETVSGSTSSVGNTYLLSRTREDESTKSEECRLQPDEAMAAGRSLMPLVYVVLLATFLSGALVDSVSVNLINDLGEPLTYACEVGSYDDESEGDLAGTLKGSQKITIYGGVEGSRSCNFWFESWNSGDLYQLEFHVCHYHVDEPDDVYEWTFTKSGVYLSDSDFKHQWRITRNSEQCACSTD